MQFLVAINVFFQSTGWLQQAVDVLLQKIPEQARFKFKHTQA